MIINIQSLKNNSHIIFKNIATLGFFGYLTNAPGTVGSALSFLTVIILRPSGVMTLLLILFLFVLGVAASHSAEITLKRRDSKHIIIDEYMGYFVSIAFLEQNLFIYITGFVFFRLFDIFKPPPIKLLERSLHGGFGVMTDDLAAGIYANIALRCTILAGLL